MAQNDYTLVLDPSGQLLQDLDEIVYQNYNVSYMPVYGQTYKLTNYNQTTIANKFIPYVSNVSLTDVQDYMTFDASDTLYITDRNAGKPTIQVFITSDSTGNAGRFADIGYTFEAFPNGEFPYGIAFDASGILYVTMNNRRSWSQVTRSWILKINLTTLVGTEVDVPGITFGHLYGCTFDNAGNFYVVDNTNNKIIKITMVNYSTGIASTYANLYNGLNRPTDICFDISGNGYISNLGSVSGGNVIKISTDNASSVFGSGLLNPYTLVYDRIDNILYVASYGSASNGLVRIINGTATLVPSLSGKPINPYSLAITSTGKLYVTSIPIPFVSEFGGKVIIYEMVPDNVLFNYDASSNTNFGITSVVFDAAYTYLYASAYNTNQILKYTNTDVSGNTRVVFYDDSSSGPSLNRPTSIAFDTIGNLYVANNSNDLIVINSSGVGALVSITGYSLNTPSSISFDGTSRLYVANYILNTICKLTFSTTTTASSVLFNTTGESIITPSSLAFNGTFTKLYVSSDVDNKIIEIDIATTFATKYNLSGLNLSYPTGIVYDSNTNILYMCNQSTNEIYYITNYNYVAKFDIIIDPSSNNYLSGPLGITLNSSSNLYIANSNNQNCPVACVRQNNTWTTIYDPNLLFDAETTNAVPDRDTQNTYFADTANGLTKVYRMDKSGILYDTLPIISTGGFEATSMTLGEDLSGNKFLAILLSSITPAKIIFIPFTPANELSSGTFTPQDLVGININNEFKPWSIVFANITTTIKALFISTYREQPTTTQTTQFIRVYVLNAATPNSTTFTSTFITIPAIVGGANINLVSYMAVYPVFQSGSYTQFLYIGARDLPRIWFTNVIQLSSVYLLTTTITFFNPTPEFSRGCVGLSLDDNGYLYALIGQRLSPTNIAIRLYRRLINTPLVTLFPDIGIPMTIPVTLIYCNWDQSLFIFSNGSTQVYKYYIGFPFTGMNSVNTIGPYDDTGYIFDITAGANTYDFSFNIYNPYVVIDPSNIPLNTRTEVSIHFVMPFNQPAPSDSYRLRCDGRDISDVFCNNCTYNKETFLAGTFPTGLVYSNFSQFLYVALDNDTISRINTFGIVENNFIPSSAGLKGPTSLVLDSRYNMFILNAGSDFISYLTLENNIISVDNSFFTGITAPICLTYDNISNDYLYLLSGIVPNMRLTKILATDASQSQIIGLPFGTLYNSNGLTICEFNPGFKFLYISDTDQNGINRIIQVSLSDGLYTPTTLITGLTYKPFTMANKNDGYLYIANKTSNNISKVSVQSVLIQPIQSVQPWVSNSISVPAGVCFDGSGNLYVANSGTNPRNSRISKIYIDYYFFTNVVISSTPCVAQIYDITTNSYVEVDYYTSPGDPTTFPIPIPYPINS
jgi:sugar lactone lactonase YvrE